MNPKPKGGTLLYNCSGVLKLDLGSNMGYNATKTVVYNDTVVKFLDKSKYCNSGSYSNPEAYSLNTNTPSDGSDQSLSV